MKKITVFLFTIFAWLQYAIWFQDGGLEHQLNQQRQNTEKLQEENRRLRWQIEVLRAEVNDFQNGFEAVSEEARSRFGYIRQGETFYSVK